MAKRILDEKKGLADGQPSNEVDDSLFLSATPTLGESPLYAPRGIALSLLRHSARRTVQ